MLEDMLYVHILQYIDDTLIYARSEEESLNVLERYFSTLMQYNIKLHPGKFVLYETQLTWGGKLVTAEGTKPNTLKVCLLYTSPSPRD